MKLMLGGGALGGMLGVMIAWPLDSVLIGQCIGGAGVLLGAWIGGGLAIKRGGW